MATRYQLGFQWSSSDVPSSPYLTNLVSYWKMDEVSGVRVDSIASSGNDLTDNNTVTQSPGIVNSAAQFAHANNEWLSHASNASLTIGLGAVDFHIVIWVYLDTTGNQCFLEKGSGLQTGTNGEYSLYYFGNQTTFSVGNGSTFATVTGGALSATTWHQLHAWLDSGGATINLQIDNGAVNTTAWAGGSFGSGTAFAIGDTYNGDPTYAMDGRGDEVALYKNRFLNASERDHYWNGGAGITYPGF